MTGLLKIEKQDYTVDNIQFPCYLVDMTSQNDYFVQIKQDLQEVFTEFFHSESFKTNEDTENFRILHYSLNQMFDDLFMAHNRGLANHLQQQIDTFNRDREESQKIKV